MQKGDEGYMVIRFPVLGLVARALIDSMRHMPSIAVVQRPDGHRP